MTDTYSPDAGADETTAPAPATIRTSLRDRRKRAQSKLFIDRTVPRLDPAVYVRFGPIPGHKIDQLGKNIEKSKDPEKTTVNNAIALAEACVGIYQVALEGETPAAWLNAQNGDDDTAVALVSVIVDEDAPRFDQQLAAELGLENVRGAVDIVRGLYMTDGDIISEAGAITEWSGWVRRDGDEEYAGN